MLAVHIDAFGFKSTFVLFAFDLFPYVICSFSSFLNYFLKFHIPLLLSFIIFAPLAQVPIWSYLLSLPCSYATICLYQTQNIVKPPKKFVKPTLYHFVQHCQYVNIPKIQLQPFIPCLKFLWIYTWLQIKYKGSRTPSQGPMPLMICSIQPFTFHIPCLLNALISTLPIFLLI